MKADSFTINNYLHRTDLLRHNVLNLVAYSSQWHDVIISVNNFCHFSGHEEWLRPGGLLGIELIERVHFTRVGTPPYSVNDYLRRRTW
jgi:hypothetical protein